MIKKNFNQKYFNILGKLAKMVHFNIPNFSSFIIYYFFQNRGPALYAAVAFHWKVEQNFCND